MNNITRDAIEWIPISGFTGYEISNNGEVKSKRKKLKLTINIDGYAVIPLRKNGKVKQLRINRLVALHFIPNPDNLPEVNHEDYNKLNNWHWNLKWCDRFYQNQHSALKPGRKFSTLFSTMIGSKNHKSKPVMQIKNGKVINQYESMNLAAKANNLMISKISLCCLNKRKTHGGFEWKFIIT